ncbi:FAD-dependent oxidoreductase [Solimonas sp. K1W22B-7]|uniref:FAD-dependent oxidoreductase n=1 Tax=Solimonas sp. K1W22B-7 TaxID=2303331 RepID=UPI000E32FD63|nr:FAD-dependent oxidoreductase [Solimonas sp. K1W22B-7]AXQ30691.1 FAD-dependent oxidoreductase [Solimonas sp. K1W22B-7]
MSASETYDVVVVGSGAAGATAALRASERGLSVLVVEKAHKYGGTSATSGGVLWVPNHGLASNDDNREKVEQYLASVMTGPVQADRLAAYLDQAPEMARFLKAQGIPLGVAAWPDYYPQAPGARIDRSLICDTFDGRELGEQFPLMREQYNRFKVFGRYSMDVMEFFSLSTRAKGWVITFLKMFYRYWTDFGTRKLTARDRRFTMGAALMGWLYKQVFARRIEVRLDTRLDELLLSGAKVTGVKVSHFGRGYEIVARHGVVLCAGGFEWNQELRDRFFPVPGLTRHSSSPEDANRGEALIAGMKIGAATEHTESGWWIPTMQMPMQKASNFEEIHQAAFDVGRPHSVAVNRKGLRFVDEASGYDDFGKAMVADQLKTGANTPCWLVFDASFRVKFSAGGIMPKLLMPDSKIPPDWWDHTLFRADSIEALAAKIHVPADTLKKTVANMNQYAVSGVDPEFGRGSNIYDQMFGDANVKPNPCLGPIDQAPYYAVAINLGDLGTKGGLKADARARVLDRQGQVIPGLYAAGNNAGSPFGNCYPGAGGTIGPAMTFGYVAASDIAARAKAG